MRPGCSLLLVAWAGAGLLLSLPAAAQGPAPEPEGAPAPEPARVQGKTASAAPPAARPGAGPRAEERVSRRQNSVAQVARDGAFLPLTVSARVGDQYVMGMALGGYDGADGQGGRFTSVVEGALYNRIALRVGVDYASQAAAPTASVGLRLGVLRQEQHHVDLGFVAQYRNQGFTESRGEIELMVTAGRRWNRFALFGNLVYGQGFEQQERDGEVRLAMLYAVHNRVNVGLDARGRFDLGSVNGQAATGPDAPFDLIAGPVATASVGPVSFLAQVGFHTLVYDDPAKPSAVTGAVAMGGLGAAY